MTAEDRKKQLKRRILRIPVFFVLLALILLLARQLIPTRRHMSPEEYFGSGDGIAVVVDGVLSDSRGRAAEGMFYMDAATVTEAVSPALFYDAGEEKLIATTAVEKRVYELAASSAGDDAFLLDGRPYIASDCLPEVAEVVIRRETEPDRLVAVTEFQPVVMHFRKDAPVRFQAGIRSPIVADCAAGQEVRVTDRTEDGEACEDKVRGWTHVVTEDGFAGYVEDRFLEDPGTREIAHSELPAYTRQRPDGRVVLVFHQTDSAASNAALAESISGISGMNVIAPTWLFLDGTDGSIRSLADASYVETAHGAGLAVYAVLNDFDGSIASAAETAEALGSDTSRSAIVRGVTDALLGCGADGLCVDIELVRKDSADVYLELIRELSVEMRNAGLVLAVCNYVPTFTSYLNRAEQARVADYLIAMCYDEHTSGSAEAGSVASLPFVRKGLLDTIAEAGEESTIAAIPFYTRLWETAEDGTLSSRAYGMRAAAARAEELRLAVSYDEEAAQDYAEGTDGGAKYQMWLENAASVKAKLQVIRESGCAGCAAWKLGLETPDIWEVIRTGLPPA